MKIAVTLTQALDIDLSELASYFPEFRLCETSIEEEPAERGAICLMDDSHVAKRVFVDNENAWQTKYLIR